MSSKTAALAAHHGCQPQKNIGSPDEPSSAEPQTSKMLSLSIGGCNRNNPDGGLAVRVATQTESDEA
jgi:hypothetical protein